MDGGKNMIVVGVSKSQPFFQQARYYRYHTKVRKTKIEAMIEYLIRKLSEIMSRAAALFGCKLQLFHFSTTHINFIYKQGTSIIYIFSVGIRLIKSNASRMSSRLSGSASQQ